MPKILVLALYYLVALHWNQYFGPTWKSEAVAAYGAADTLAAMTAKAGRPPRQTNPEAAKLLDTVFNITEPSDPSPILSIKAILDWQLSSQRVRKLYLKAALSDERNFMIYAPEIGRQLDTTLQLNIEAEDALIDGARQQQSQLSPTQRQLSNLVAATSTALLTNELEDMTLPNVTDDWRSKRMSVLTQAAHCLPGALSAQQRRSVYEAAKGAMEATRSKNLNGQLAVFQYAFEDLRLAGLMCRR